MSTQLKNLSDFSETDVPSGGPISASALLIVRMERRVITQCIATRGLTKACVGHRRFAPKYLSPTQFLVALN